MIGRQRCSPTQRRSGRPRRRIVMVRMRGALELAPPTRLRSAAASTADSDQPKAHGLFASANGCRASGSCRVLTRCLSGPSVRQSIYRVQVSAADKVRVGTVGNSSDAGFFIRRCQRLFQSRGARYFVRAFRWRRANDGASRSLGELDVGGGTASAGLYNAAARNIGIKVVADRSRTEAGYLFQNFDDPQGARR